MPYPDFEEFIAALNTLKVRYLVVGELAFAHHARPRATNDLEVLIDAASANARNVLQALDDFLGTDSEFTVEDLMDPDWLIHLGDAPNRIGIRTRLLGYPKFATLWKNRVVAQFGNVPANFLGLDDLIAAKGASEQTKDWADRHELNLVKKRTRRTPGQEPT